MFSFVYSVLNVTVNSFGHIESVSWPNHIFFLDKAVNQ